jgi:hypothetical protein
MLRWVILVVAVVALTAVATVAVPYLTDPGDARKVPVVEVNGPQPKLVLEAASEFDFGKMARFDKATHGWLVKNEGEIPLEIWQHGQTTCSCTVAKPGLDEKKNPVKMVIAPGKSDTVELGWHTDKDLGKDYSQGATFGTNDPRQPFIKLTVKGKVYPSVEIVPPQMIQFPRISSEEPHRARFLVFSQERPELKVLKVETSKPDLIVGQAQPMTSEEAAMVKVTKGYRVDIEVKPGMPLGNFHEELVVHTDHPKQPEVKVSVGGFVFGPISVTPERVRMTGVVGAEGATRELLLVVSKGKETHFEVAQKPEKLEVAIAQDDHSKVKGRYRLTVTVPKGTAPGDVEGEIVLRTDHPRAKEVKIPVSILISRSRVG